VHGVVHSEIERHFPQLIPHPRSRRARGVERALVR
jgi:hypothetical protein